MVFLSLISQPSLELAWLGHTAQEHEDARVSHGQDWQGELQTSVKLVRTPRNVTPAVSNALMAEHFFLPQSQMLEKRTLSFLETFSTRLGPIKSFRSLD